MPTFEESHRNVHNLIEAFSGLISIRDDLAKAANVERFLKENEDAETRNADLQLQNNELIASIKEKTEEANSIVLNMIAAANDNVRRIIDKAKKDAEEIVRQARAEQTKLLGDSRVLDREIVGKKADLSRLQRDIENAKSSVESYKRDLADLRKKYGE